MDLRGWFEDEASTRGTGVAAAAIGAVLSLAFMKGVKPRDAVVAICCGVAMSYYFTDIMTVALHASSKANGAIGFGIGLFAMTFMAGAMKLVASWRDNPRDVLRAIVAYLPWIRGRNG